MKKFIILSVLLFAYQFVIAQITVSSAILPSVGDSYTYYIDSTALGISSGSAGANQNWDFSKAEKHRVNVEAFKDPSGLAGVNNFPNSNLATSNQGVNLFLRVTTKNLELLGTFSNNNPLFGGPTVYDKPAVILRTPLDYLDQYDYTVNQAFQISGRFIPDSLTMGFSIDSIRIKIKQDVSVVVDAWGKVKLPMNSYDVLRQKRNTTNIITVEAKIPLLGWIDITSIASGFFGGFLNAGSNTEYVYVSNQSKGFIATVMVDSLGNPTNISYKAENVATSNPKAKSDAFGINSNLVSDELILLNQNSVESDLSLEIVMSNGMTCKASEINLIIGQSQHIDLAYMIPSEYILVVKNRSGKILWTKNFMKL